VENALPVDVELDEQTAAVNIQPAIGKLYGITGALLRPPGSKLSSVSGMLAPVTPRHQHFARFAILAYADDLGNRGIRLNQFTYSDLFDNLGALLARVV
jgi:hypothetical protein